MEKQYSFTSSKSQEEETILTCKVNPEKYLVVKNKVFNRLAKDVKMPGFRPGKAPKAVIEASISNQVMDDTLNEVIPEITALIMEENDITPLNQVRYELVKVSDAEGVEFKANFVALPEIKLGDFAKIKIKKEEKKVTDSDIANEITKIFQYYNKNKKEGKDTTDKQSENKDINDESVKALGIGFNDLKALEEQVKKELEAASVRNSEVKWLDDLVREAVKQSKIKVPQILISQSVNSKEKDYLKKLEELNLQLEEFLKVQKTSMQELREQWKKEAEQRFSEELLLLMIIRNQKIQVSDTEVNAEIAKITDEKTKSELSTNDGKRYLITVMLQQKAITWLKEQTLK